MHLRPVASTVATIQSRIETKNKKQSIRSSSSGSKQSVVIRSSDRILGEGYVDNDHSTSDDDAADDANYDYDKD